MNYISKIYLITIFATPFIYWPVNIYLNNHSILDLEGFVPVVFITMFVSSFLSLPTFLILYFYLEQTKKKREQRNVKQIAALIGSLGVACTFALFDFSIFESLIGLLFPASYILSICFSAFFFKVQINPNQTNYG